MEKKEMSSANANILYMLNYDLLNRDVACFNLQVFCIIFLVFSRISKYNNALWVMK